MIDVMIIEAVMRDSQALSVSSLKPKFLVGTGQWKLVEDENGDHILFKDDFINQGKIFAAQILEDCELVEGERLVLLTSVLHGGLECGLVLFKDQAVESFDGGLDATDVG